MIGLDKLDVDVAVVLGKVSMPLRELLQLGRGAVIALDATEGDRVEVLGNGHPIARGEVVVTGGTISVEVKDMIRRESVVREVGARIGDVVRSHGGA